MTEELTGAALEEAVAEEMKASEERYQQWLATTTPEQLAAMNARTDRMMGHVLLVYALKMTPERFKALADADGVSEETQARVRERMKSPPYDDPEFQAAAETLGGLPSPT